MLLLGCGSRWGSGAVVQFVGDGVVVGLVAGDGGSLGQVTKGEPVLVFVGSCHPGVVRGSEIHIHTRVVGQAPVAGDSPPFVPDQCEYRSIGKAPDTAGQRAGFGWLSYPEGRATMIG